MFFADEERIGSGTLEPSDLIWATRDVVVFFFLKHSDRPNRPHVPHGRELSAIKKNLSQARGVLKEWRQRNLPLKGRNPYQEFSIPFKGQQVVVVSVLDTKDSYALFHQEETARLGVAAVCTLPQQAIHSLSVFNLGIVDLLHVIDIVRKCGLAIPAPQIEFAFNTIACGPWFDRELSELWPNRWSEPSYQRLEQLVSSLKHAPSLEDPFPGLDIFKDLDHSAVAFAELFSDIPHRDILGLLMSLGKVWNGPSNHVTGFGQYSGQFHDIGFAFSPHCFPHPGLESHMNDFVKGQATGKLRPGPLMMIDPLGKGGLIFFGRRDTPSFAATILQTMKEDGPRVVGLRSQTHQVGS